LFPEKPTSPVPTPPQTIQNDYRVFL